MEIIIIPNPTMTALSAVPFLVTVVALYFILFKPLLAYIDARAEAGESGKREAAGLDAQVSTRTAELEARLATVRAEVTELRATRRAAAIHAAQAQVSAARHAADARVKDAVAQLDAERGAAKAALAVQARSLATQVAGQVLGRPVAAG